MKKAPLIRTALLVVPMLALSAFAQDDEGDGLSVTPVDTWACSFNDGKGMDDLKPVIKMWNDMLDDGGVDDHFAIIVTPQYFSDMKMDFGWLESYGTAESAGAVRDSFMGEAEMGAAWDEVIKCSSHTNYASVQIKAPPEGDAPDTFVLGFSTCNIADGKTWDDVFAGADAWAAWQTENSMDNGTWFLFPAWGEPDGYDFKVVNSYGNHKELGRGWDIYGNGGGWQKFGEVMAGNVDCDNGRIYDATVLRRPTAE